MEREIIFTKKAPKPRGSFSQAIKASNFIFVSGQTARNVETGEILFPGNVEAQTEVIMKNIKNILESADSSLSKIIKSNVFIDDINNWDLFNKSYKTFFSKDFPTRRVVSVGNFAEGICIEIDVIAIC